MYLELENHHSFGTHGILKQKSQDAFSKLQTITLDFRQECARSEVGHSKNGNVLSQTLPPL